MFKVESSAEAKEIGNWEITHVESGKVIAEISTFHGFRRSKKHLKVNDKVIAEVDNQKEALEKLGEFFERIKKDISELEERIEILEESKSVLNHEYPIIILDNEIKRLKERVENLEQYNLV